MRKSNLVVKISQLEGFSSPKVSLEQYLTPPDLAADLIFTAFMQGDIEGKHVVDLGAGTGILGIAAELLGAKVTGVEKDPDALEIARKNAEKTGSDIEFVEDDIGIIQEKFDTVVMNPPFSVHSDEGMKFVEKAFSISDAVYMIANRSSRASIKDFAEESNHEIQAVEEFKISLPPTFGFHTEENRETPVDLIITRRLN